MKKIYQIILLASVMVIMSCSNSEKKIAIVNLMQHPVLDAVQNETIEYLENNGYSEDQGYTLVVKNLNGQKEILPTVVNEILSQNPEAVIAITTPVAQAFYGKTKCPLIFSLVTDPIEAGILDSMKQVKPNLTGTSDVFPYERQLELIRQIHPDAKKLGLIYDPGEAPARFALNELERICPSYGFELTAKPASATNEVPQAANSLIGVADVLFISSDNTAIEAVPSLFSVCVKNKIPLYVGETGSVERGGIATCSVSYGSFGTKTGELASRMIKGETNLPVYVPSEYEIVLNTSAAKLMGVELDSTLIAKANKVINEVK